MSSSPLSATEIDALLRLLDDDTPAVRERVTERLAGTGGDLSAWFAKHPPRLSPTETELLTDILRPAKRETLAHLWEVAITGRAKVGDLDWPEIEPLLALLSEYLHDGITPRAPMGAALLQLATHAREAGVTDEMELRKYLFVTLAFKGNQEGYHDPRNCDLAWSIAGRRSNPIGLCLIYLLVARQLDLKVEGVAFPGHFLCRIHPEGVPIIIDCFNDGQIHFQDVLLEPESDLSRQQRSLLHKTAAPGTMLVRVLNNLAAAFQAAERKPDFQLIQQLRATLQDS
ncbi:MAG: transglutaminase-like domain-containing protein [Akkermansiaceae bacterium]|nr:transglutaminase-like domain-containing protein [Akkermansiaceae bacterium]